jgi:hypothetical protein
MAIHEVIVKQARADGTYDEGITILKGRGVKFDEDAPLQVRDVHEFANDAGIDPSDLKPGVQKKKQTAPKKQKTRRGNGNGNGNSNGNGKGKAAAEEENEDDDEVEVVGQAGRTGDHVGKLVHWCGVVDMVTSHV